MKMQTRSEKGISIDCSGDQIHLLHEIMKAHQALLGIFSREVGMPSARLVLLRLLAISHPDGIGVMEIARQLGVNAAAVTRQVKEMEAERLISRFPDLRDGRRNYVKLTSKGVQILEKIHKRAHKMETRLCKEINPDDLDIAIRVLSQIRAAIDKQ
jgi:DNA-binding MarR family transcriptional regulator